MKSFESISLEEGTIFVKTARRVVTEFLKNGKVSSDNELKAKYSYNSGIFVTLSKKSELRGCIGYPLPHKKLYNALEDAAIAAATEDPRFPSVRADELADITFEVTVLTPPEKIIVSDTKDYIKEIKVGRDGLIVKNGFYSGLLLPQVAVEYGWDSKQFLEYTCQKANLPTSCWKEKDTEISRFQGIVFKETKPNGTIVREEL